MRVIKRDGTYQPLDMAKIQRAMLMAFSNTREQIPDVGPIVHRTMSRLPGGDMPVAGISEAIEAELCSSGFGNVAAAFMRHKLSRDAARTRRMVPDSKALSDYIHVAKYARYNGERRELHAETVTRVMDMHIRRFPEHEEEIRAAFAFVYSYKLMPSMRSMQFGGAAIEQNHARMYNCSFTLVDRWRVFQEIFFLLLSGCGVGFSVQWQHVDCLGEVGTIDPKQVFHYEIPDTIEGWADALGVLIESYRSGVYVEFSYAKIRAEGELLKTSGGKAPGHIPLKIMLERVREVLDAAQGRKLRPLECHDIICHAAEAVLAGGIRRSSLISLFSLNDTEMLYSKAKGNFRPAWGTDPGLNSHRQMANNSAALLRGSVSRAEFDRIIRVAQENYGCPGFYFTNDLDYGANPCGEIGLYPVIGWSELSQAYFNYKDEFGPLGDPLIRRTGFSFCNLVECNGALVSTQEDLVTVAQAGSFIGTLQASYTDFPYLGSVTEAIVRREALLGVGLTGIQDSEVCRDPESLERAARAAVDTNRAWARRLGIEIASRVTTVKPSGTASKALGGVGEGIHPRYARRFFQRVTANPLEPAAQYFKSVNPHMVDTKPNGDWSIRFPIQCSDSARTVKEMPAMDFVEDVLTVYQHWIRPGTSRPLSAPGLTHNVSCTVTLRDGEIDAVLDTIWDRRRDLCAMSFVPLILDKSFPFIPKREVYPEDEEAWNNLIEMYRPVDWSQFKEDADTTTRRLTVACGPEGCA